MMDRIIIRDLACRCIIGFNSIERKKKQKVVMTIEIFCNLRHAARTDNIKNCMDYKKLKKEILAFTRASKFFLLETLAEQIAKLCLKHKPIRKVRIILDKPGALRFARSVAINIIRR